MSEYELMAGFQSFKPNLPVAVLAVPIVQSPAS